MTLPTGTVTFLFTDIEGSTKLARTYPETWETTRGRHDAILRAAIELNSGFVFQVLGDSFYAAFHKAGDALNAALTAQRDLQSEPWGEAVIRVRMGIHTGEAETDGRDYHGYLTLSLVQRMMSAGHGGQILLSNTTENLLRGQLPTYVSLRDMGEHKLKDAPLPVRIFQVVTPDLPSDFPALRALDVFPNNLPTQLTSFVGREKELTDVKKLLHDAHMLTLIGPGGTGKTRLSIQSASESLTQYADGVWLVELAPILDPLLVPRTTAIAIGLRDEPQRPVIDMLCDYLREKNMLILLDNCEHLVDTCAQMADRILHAAPNVRILASGREALGIPGEVTYRVPSLGLPDLNHLPPVESMSQYEAVKLFIDRATSAVSTFTVTNENAPALAQICHRLDGIPLAIELAAAKIRVLSVEQIAKRLDDRFRLLTGGSRTALERHQTLRAAIDWSYNLLPPAEQILFRRLSIFVGGWTLEAAESVCGDPSTKLKAGSGLVRSDDVLNLMEQLINKSLVIAEEVQGESRYRMLETMRQYANEKLVESGESDMLRDRHLDYFLNLTEAAEPYLRRTEQVEWLRRLNADYENLRVALAWSLDKDSAESALRLSGSMGIFWSYQNYWLEGKKWLTGALNRNRNDSSAVEKAARAKALLWIAVLAEKLDDLEDMLASAEKGVAIYEEIRNGNGLALAQALLGFAYSRLGEYEHGQKILEQSVDSLRSLNNDWGLAFALGRLAWIYRETHEVGLYEKFHGEAHNLHAVCGDRYQIALSLNQHAGWLYQNYQLNQAETASEEADRIFRDLGSSQEIPLTWYVLSSIAFTRGDHEQAKAICLKAAGKLELLGEKNNRATAYWLYAFIAMDEDDYDTALRYLLKTWESYRTVFEKEAFAFLCATLGQAYYFHGDPKLAKERFRQSLDSLQGVDKKTHFTFPIFSHIASVTATRPGEATAQILGAADAFRQSVKQIDPIFLLHYDRIKEKARSLSGDAKFDSAFALGQKMSLAEALDLVLKIVEQM